ncbi:MAG: MMPL family transporter [Clostridiales bacterium]|nr:MMPL family transporter [Clostridiales bacterium]
MKKPARFIVKHRVLILVTALLLLIPSALGYLATYVNYDILSYLPEEVESMQGQALLENDFELASTAMIVVDKMEQRDVQKLKEKIAAVEGVKQALWVDDIADITIPKELLPEDFRKFFYSDTGTMLLVSFQDTTAAKSTMDALDEIQRLTGEQCFVGGMAAILHDTKALADSEMPLYIVVAVALLLAVLMLGMESWVVPFIFILGIVFPIIYNFGTNIFLGQISYVTKALAAVLQLGVTMDFSIFLLHRYLEEKEKRPDREEAMAQAIQATFSSITGSSVTTVFGFLALCTMSLALGRDIGIVMAKGVLLGVLCTLTVLPALILFFDKPIQKYRHRTLIRPFSERFSGRIVKHRWVYLAVFLVLIVPFGLAQSKADVYYALDETLPADLPSIVGTNKLKNDFHMTTTHFVLVDENLESYQVKDITNQISRLDGVELALSYEAYIGGGLPDEMQPAAVKDLLRNGGKEMIVVNSVYRAASDEENAQLDAINAIIKPYDPTALIAGEGALTKDLIQVADTDFRNVNIASILAIFLVIALLFKSVSIPVLLVAAIEFAITVNMGIPYFTGSSIPFVASIVIGTIQLGATVDYAILMTTRFREERRRGMDAKAAMQESIHKCSSAIVTSGLSFFGANIGVCFISKMDLIKSLCLMMARGALISMLTILFVLPAILIVCDKLVAHTSIGWLKNKKNKESVQTRPAPVQ